MKRYLLVIGGLVLVTGLLIVFALANAETTAGSTGSTATSTTIAPMITEVSDSDLRQELTIKEIYGRRVKCKEYESASKCPEYTPSNQSSDVLVKAAKVTGIGTNSIKISIFGLNYEVDTSNAKIVRQYWGGSTLNEFSVGDIVNVYGYLDAYNLMLIHAQTVRNVSIQKVNNIFGGTVTNIINYPMPMCSITSTSTEPVAMCVPPSPDTNIGEFTLKTDNRGIQTVIVNGKTQFMNASGTSSFGNLQVGMNVSVRGLWDKTQSKINANLVKIYSGTITYITTPATCSGSETSSCTKPFYQNDDSVRDNQKKIEKIQEQINELLKKLGSATTTHQ